MLAIFWQHRKQVPFNRRGQTCTIRFFAPTSGYDAVVSPQLMAGWLNLDKRKFASVDTGYTDAKTGSKSTRPQFTKFLEKGATTAVDRYDYPNNYPVIRYEDVLLMYAEILNEEAAAPPAAAITILNRIRTRAGVANVTPVTKAEFKLAMEQERAWEFRGEGLRWHDLVRTGRAIEVVDKFLKTNLISLGRSLDDHDLLYPIPLKELLINPDYWKQNSGYN